GQCLESEDLAARKHGSVDAERGVFGGGADQRDGAVLQVRQKSVLLSFVETVDLVHEQQRAAPLVVAALASRLDDQSEVCHATQHGAERYELLLAAARQHMGQGGLASA